NTGDVPFGGALRNGADVYVVPAKRPKHFPRNAGMAFHLITNDGNDRLVWFFIQRSQFVVKLQSKFLSHRRSRCSPVRISDGKTDGVLGRSVGDQDDADTARGQRAKQSVGISRDADHAKTAES